MNMKNCLFIVFCFFTLAVMGNLNAQEAVQPVHDVEVRVFLIDVEGVDTVSQSFTANLIIVMRWRDPGLAHENPTSLNMPLDDIWYPRIQIINQQNLTLTLPKSAEVLPDGEVVYRQRFWGSFSQPLDLQAFPFDSQSLKITLANVGFGGEFVKLTPSPNSGISESLSMPDWVVTGWDFIVTSFPIEDESSPIQGMIFSLDVQRDKSYFKFKVIFPLVLIVMMSWLVFWIDPILIASQISVSVTAMLTIIAYRFALAGMVPRLAFLTSLDYFVMASNLIVFLAMIEVVYTAYLSTNGQLEKARKVDRNMRWIAPLIYFVVVTEILFLRIWV